MSLVWGTRKCIVAIALAAGLACSVPAHADAIGVNRVESEHITANELALLGWYGVAYRVTFWQGMTDAERDNIVWNAHVQGVDLLPILIVRYDGVAHEPRGGAWDEWAAYVAKVVRRYPTVRAWEVWNEPNARKFGGAFAVRRWRRFVARTARVIHEARPDVRVVAGGVSVVQPGWQRYLKVSGVDGVGVHPYAHSAARALRFVRQARRVARKPVWVTELGWNGGGERYAARELRRFVRGFHGPTYWYHLQDNPHVPSEYASDGLFSESWRPKPAWKQLLLGRTPR